MGEEGLNCWRKKLERLLNNIDHWSHRTCLKDDIAEENIHFEHRYGKIQAGPELETSLLKTIHSPRKCSASWLERKAIKQPLAVKSYKLKQ